MESYLITHLLQSKVSKFLVIIAAISFGTSFGLKVQAQITPDDSLGTQSSTVTPDVEVKGEAADRIDGGAMRDRSLFHSFEDFNVDGLQRVYFANPDGIEQIFTRVTGGNPSNIFGTLGVDGAADLLLLNPNGILFGENSSLDVEGSFFGTTADSVLFEDGSEFSAVNPQSSLLTVSVPLGLQIGDNPGSIELRSPLEVANGENFSLVGGEANLTGSGVEQDEVGVNFAAEGITASGGKIELGGLSTEGKVDFEDNSNLNFPEDIPKANVNLDNFFLDVSAGGGGSIAIHSQNLKLANSLMIAGIDATLESTNAQAGDITIDTDRTILEASRDSQSGIYNVTGGNIPKELFGSEVDNDAEIVNTKGNAGNIFIRTNSLSAKGYVAIVSSTYGEGNAGNVEIDAEESILLETPETSAFSAEIFNRVRASATGNAGDIKINTPSLYLDDVYVSASTESAGNAGNIFINASDSVVIDDGLIVASTTSSGNAGNIVFKSPTADLTFKNQTRIITETFEEGNAGNLTIQTSRLAVEDSAISASTEGLGQAGNINIIASEGISLKGFLSVPEGNLSTLSTFTTGDADAGNIDIKTENLTLSEVGRIDASTFGAGNSGNINIETKSTEITGISESNFPSSITASSFNSGTGGNIAIKTDSLVLRNGVISSESIGNGDAGNINLDTGKLTVENSIITTFSQNAGQAGNLNIKASELVDLRGISNDGEDFVYGGLSTSATDNAIAGSVTIDTSQLRISEGAQIIANTLGTGDGGNVDIEAEAIQLKGNSGEGFSSAIAAFTNGRGDGGAINITANNLVIADQAGISASSTQEGNSGEIFVQVGDSLEVDNGFISSFSDRSSGGEINISAGAIGLKGSSLIETSVIEGEGGGGNITLSADSIVAFDDSDIFAFSADGQGGNITFNTNAFFASSYSSSFANSNPEFLVGNNRVDINASGSVAGVVDVPEVNFLPSDLVKLSEDTIDSDEVIANSCVVRNGQPGGTFMVTGSGGLPTHPGDAAISDYSTGSVRSVPKQPTKVTDNWQPGDPIAEPEGVYRLANGKLVLSRQCSSE